MKWHAFQKQDQNMKHMLLLLKWIEITFHLKQITYISKITYISINRTFSSGFPHRISFRKMIYIKKENFVNK